MATSYHLDDTICAIASAVSGAARGIIRVSGPSAVQIVTPRFRADDGQPLERLRQASAISGQFLLDGGVISGSVPCDIFVWPTERSYTREPVVEVHTLGSPPLLESLIAQICNAGARLAEPGEFTMRAFLAGRIDLTQAEAVLGVIDAHHANDLEAALVQLAGGLAQPLHGLRTDLLQLLAEIEAGLDFAEEDIEFLTPAEIARRIHSASQALANVAQQFQRRHAGTETQQVVLFGQPNAGKSSLFNALVERCGVNDEANDAVPAAALVSPRPGTTRDYLTAIISLDGVRCELIDTAGVFETTADNRADPAPEIESLAAAHAVERRTRATLRLCCVEATELLTQAATAATGNRSDHDVLVMTKCDLVPHHVALPTRPGETPTVRTSSMNGTGLGELAAILRTLLGSEQAAQRGHAVASTAARCGESLRLASGAIERAAEIAKQAVGHEFLAAELRTALDELGKVVGAVYTDDLLSRIFSTFCIGK